MKLKFGGDRRLVWVTSEKTLSILGKTQHPLPDTDETDVHVQHQAAVSEPLEHFGWTQFILNAYIASV